MLTKAVPNFGTTTYTYDTSEGNGLYSETTTDFKNNLTKQVYDKVGRLYQVIADTKTTTYEYYTGTTKAPVNNQNTNPNNAGKSKEIIQDAAGIAVQGGNFLLRNAYDASLEISPYTQTAVDVYKVFSPLYFAFALTTYMGWFPGAFDVAGFTMNEETGTYHAKQSGSIQSLKYVGYNNFYDGVFNCFTRMNKAKFPFEYNQKEYIFWAWKGDYMNLGAGAEMGIYTSSHIYGEQTEHWLIDKSLAMPMTLKVDYFGKNIIDYKPSEKQWWITGFKPAYQF